MGRVTEFGFSDGVGRGFGGKLSLAYLRTIGQNWNLLPSKAALTFIDNHDSQRSGNPNILTYKTPRDYRMATAFMFTYPYGLPRIMSSFAFNTSDQGPPSTADGEIISPTINPDESCGSGYVCEHRWPVIMAMVYFNALVANAPLKYWWDNGANQIAFARYRRGFIAFNRDGGHQLNQTLQTGMPEGCYCDLVTVDFKEVEKCKERNFMVDKSGFSDIFIDSNDENGIVAFTFLQRLGDNCDT